MEAEYRTIAKRAEAEIEEKKSRFIATVMPVSTEEEALLFINHLKKKYWDATHNVYAYSVYEENVVQRFSDDGEPSGTAGIPVLEVIKKAHIQNAAIVVTRYFGGTLLGAGGLVRAYGKCAAAGISAAGVIKKQLCVETIINTDYSLLGKIQNFLKENNYVIKDTLFAQDVKIIVYVPIMNREKFQDLIIDLTNAGVLMEEREEVYISLPD